MNNKLNRKGFFSTLFGGITGIVAGTSVKATEPTAAKENIVTCDKLVFKHSSGAICTMQFKDSDNFEIKLNDDACIRIHSPLEKPEVNKNSIMFPNTTTPLTIISNGYLGLGTSTPTAKLDILGNINSYYKA